MTPAAARRAAWPIALVPCLRLVWQRALFPAATDPDRRVRLRSLALLVVLPGLLRPRRSAAGELCCFY